MLKLRHYKCNRAPPTYLTWIFTQTQSQYRTSSNKRKGSSVTELHLRIGHLNLGSLSDVPIVGWTPFTTFSAQSFLLQLCFNNAFERELHCNVCCVSDRHFVNTFLTFSYWKRIWWFLLKLRLSWNCSQGRLCTFGDALSLFEFYTIRSTGN